ncbi:MAG: hypothetical protein M0042_12995 [Nitrospiraceae bacterium]|nr:hypothetical protein [Nitrospiraceae bacterium]
MTKQELLIAEIYRFFSGLYPEARDFWDRMAKEEMEHATWVEYFHTKTQNNTVHFLEEKIKSYTVEAFVKYLEDNLAKVREKAPPLEVAFSLAMNIENSNLVRRVFDHFHSSDHEAATLLQTLRIKMRDHRKNFEDMSAKISAAQKSSEKLLM